MFTLIWPYQVSLKLVVCVLESLKCDVGALLWTVVPQERASTAFTHPSPNERSFMGKLADLDLTNRQKRRCQSSLQQTARIQHTCEQKRLHYSVMTCVLAEFMISWRRKQLVAFTAFTLQHPVTLMHSDQLHPSHYPEVMVQIFTKWMEMLPPAVW